METIKERKVCFIKESSTQENKEMFYNFLNDGYTVYHSIQDGTGSIIYILERDVPIIFVPEDTKII